MIGVISGVFGIFLLIYGVFLLHKAWWWIRFSERIVAGGKEIKVSIIIPARNEAGNIESCLKAISLQKYPSELLEIIVVDDHSTDNTAKIATDFSQKDHSIQVIQLADFPGKQRKKAAIEVGIQSASGEIILTTDADCQMGPNWVSAMIAQFDQNTDLVSGPVLLTGSGAFAKMQTLEFMGLIAVGAASIVSGQPNMCNGANLAYRKSAFNAVDGFQDNLGLASGDDEFLMHKIASNGGGVAFAKSQEAIVRTAAPSDWKTFRNQRIRWVSKSTHYKRKSITAILVVSWLAMLGFPVWIGLGFWNPIAWYFAVAGLGWKILVECCVLLPATRFFRRPELLVWLVPEQVLHIAYVLWVGVAGNLGNYEWKGRIVR